MRAMPRRPGASRRRRRCRSTAPACAPPTAPRSGRGRGSSGWPGPAPTCHSAREPVPPVARPPPGTGRSAAGGTSGRTCAGRRRRNGYRRSSARRAGRGIARRRPARPGRGARHRAARRRRWRARTGCRAAARWPAGRSGGSRPSAPASSCSRRWRGSCRRGAGAPVRQRFPRGAPAGPASGSGTGRCGRCSGAAGSPRPPGGYARPWRCGGCPRRSTAAPPWWRSPPCRAGLAGPCRRPLRNGRSHTPARCRSG
ncbi:hypothetical protein IHMA87_04077 [Pseudomonas paraeruginosa]|nr:hypothetical protein IHMA87_04077 [Pseudomonas aeruginosa]